MKTVLTLICLVCLMAFVMPATSNANGLTVDEIIYETSGDTDPGLLSGKVEMAYSDGTTPTLMITLTNTSSGIASTTASHNLLTGLGFVLPDSLYIFGGSVIITSGSMAINFSSGDVDVEGEWGYDNNPLDSGPFQTSPSGITHLTVNTVVSSTVSSSKDGTFSGVAVSNLDGPGYGLLSDMVDSSVAGGLPAIQNSITLSLYLGGSWEDNEDFTEAELIDAIKGEPVVLAFGSPNAVATPEPTTLFLFGIGLVGLSGLGRKKFIKKR